MDQVLDLAALQKGRGNTFQKAIAPRPKVAVLPEKERLARREAIKGRIARLAIIEADRNAIQAESVGYDAEADRLAAEHVESMATLQAELRDIEERRIQATIDRKPANPDDEARRVVLIDTLAEANNALDVALKAIRKKSAGIHNRLMSCLTASEGCSVEGERRKLIELGKPALQDELFVSNLAFQSAVSRIGRARAEAANSVGDEVMLRRWNLELAVATEAREMADAEMARIREELIAE